MSVPAIHGLVVRTYDLRLQAARGISMNEQLEQHMPKLEELAAEVKDLAWDGDEAKLREEAGRLALSVLVLVRILRVQQRPSEF